MTKEEIWEKLATEVKLRGFSPQTYHTYKCNINGFLDWAGKPYEELDEDDFRNYLILLINEGRIEKGTINLNSRVYFVTTNSPEVEKGWCPMGSMHPSDV